jgi:hypothetical protein
LIEFFERDPSVLLNVKEVLANAERQDGVADRPINGDQRHDEDRQSDDDFQYG